MLGIVEVALGKILGADEVVVVVGIVVVGLYHVGIEVVLWFRGEHGVVFAHPDGKPLVELAEQQVAVVSVPAPVVVLEAWRAWVAGFVVERFLAEHTYQSKREFGLSFALCLGCEVLVYESVFQLSVVVAVDVKASALGGNHLVEPRHFAEKPCAVF